MPLWCHTIAMTSIITLDASNRIVLTRDVPQAAGIATGQKLRVSASPGRIVIEVEGSPGKIVSEGRLNVWTGEVPETPLDEAVDQSRHYGR
jgi:hypothetical protein